MFTYFAFNSHFEDAFNFLPQYLFEPDLEKPLAYIQNIEAFMSLLSIKFLPHFLSATLELCNIFQLNYEKHIQCLSFIAALMHYYLLL